MSMIEVITVRHPDFSNELYSSQPVHWVDIDLGRADLSQPDEFKQWAINMLDEHDRLTDSSLQYQVREAVRSTADEFSHIVPGWAVA